MKRSILTFLMAAGLMWPGAILTAPVAEACPVPVPATLLRLYSRSDAIYVANHVGSEKGKVVDETEYYTESESIKRFNVERVLKGGRAKSYLLYDTELTYKPTKADRVDEAEPEMTAEDADTTEFDIEVDADKEDDSLKPGDRVLLFLQTDKKLGRLVPADRIGGVKRLDRDALGAYEARIRDLSDIYASDGDHTQEVVDWLIKCIDDPATRWEGAFELNRSFNALRNEISQKAEEEARANGEPPVPRPLVYGPYYGADPSYARLLNDFDKQSLTNIVMLRQPGDVISRGDNELIDLVRNWGGHRLAALLVEGIRTSSGADYERWQMANTIATLLGDHKLFEIAQQFGGFYYRPDDLEVVSGDGGTAEPDAGGENMVPFDP
ncbi:MAG: hypothetical protein K1X36_14325 [Pyrinomonadaceae bacterium]|nr:hypothetical protein [Pyrinomonadaceae bacterium]